MAERRSTKWDRRGLRDGHVRGRVEVVRGALVRDLQRVRAVRVMEHGSSSGVASECQDFVVALDRQNRGRTGVVAPARHARRRRRETPGVVQGTKIVRCDAILIARQNQRRGSTRTRHGDCMTKRGRDPFLPFVVHAHVNRQVVDCSFVLIRITSENHQHRPHARRQRASTLPSQQRFTTDGHQLLRAAEPGATRRPRE